MSRKGWLFVLILAVILAVALYFFATGTESGRQMLASWTGGGTPAAAPAAQGEDVLPEGTSTVQIQPAASMLGEVSASGNIDLVTLRSVAVEVDGAVDQVLVNPGDTCSAAMSC